METQERQLRPFQKEVLEILGTDPRLIRHVICVAPTGSGKSLIYERAAASPLRRTLLITPLIALARQQFQQLKASGVRVTLGAGEREALPPPPRSGAWILSPEMLLSSSRQAMLKKWNPNFLVVDECHCLWDWGESFRPAFLEVPKLVSGFDLPQSLWLTATLPPKARAALKREISFPCIEVGQFALPASLKFYLHRASWPERLQKTMQWALTQKEGGLIFVSTRKDTLRITRLLTAMGKQVVSYHGGLSSEERRNIENLVFDQNYQIVVATSAFGMGMNFPHLKSVLLWQSPSSILALVQAIGRVGRGTDRFGQATVFWDPGDFQLLEWSLGESKQRHQDFLDLIRFYESKGCRRLWLKNYFNEKTQTLTSEPCHGCDVCMRLFQG
ncbi:MAG: ATP-dependent DNA helicase RecQ [Bdellovibrio sp.]|nr:ATP-dependent DNA helicase RecQ [Bdellovibrio sp.]